MRPRMQADYGMPRTLEGTLTWGHVERLLSEAMTYWVVTVGRDGAPQATPVWAAWVDGALYLSCGRETVKARNLARNPRVAVHLEPGNEAVMLRGVAEEVHDAATERRLIAVMRAKYGAAQIPDSFDELNGTLYVVRVTSALAWSDFPKDITRWEPV